MNPTYRYMIYNLPKGLIVEIKNLKTADIDSCIIQTCSEINPSKMRRSISSQRAISVEEHEELINTMQNLQIQLRALSTQVLTITEITIQHLGRASTGKGQM
jgi:hypothetical protein